MTTRPREPIKSQISVSVSGVACVHRGSDATKELTSQLSSVNHLCVRGGNSYSYGNFLFLKEDLTDSFLGNSNHSIKFKDGDTEVTYSGFRILKTLNLVPNDLDKALVLVEFVDARYLAMNHKVRLDIEPFPPSTVTPTGSHETSWEAAIEAYWNATGIGASVEFSKASFPTILLKDVQFDQDAAEYAWDKLFAILEAVSHTVGHNPDGTYSILSKGTFYGTNIDLIGEDDTKKRLMGKRYDKGTGLAFLPENVRVCYRKLEPDLYNQFQRFTHSYTGSLETIPGSVKDIFLWNVHSSDVNSDLITLADEVADLFFDSYTNHNKYNAIYFGVLPFENGPDVFHLEYYEDNTNGVSLVTRIKSIEITEPFGYTIGLSKGSKNGRLIKAPEGGIPPRVGVNAGLANCSVLELDDVGAIQDTTIDIDVYNWGVSAACVNGERYGFAEHDGNVWWIVSEDCSDTGNSIQTIIAEPLVTIPSGSPNISTPQAFTSPQYQFIQPLPTQLDGGSA